VHTCQSVISRRKPETKRRPSVIKQGFYKNVRRSDFVTWPDEKIRQHPRYRLRSELGRRDVISHDEAKGKVKCTLVQSLRLCTGRTAHRGNRGIALPFLDHGTRRGWGVSVTPRPLFTPGKDQVPIVQEAGWAPGAVWTGEENFAAPGFDPRTVQPVVSR